MTSAPVFLDKNLDRAWGQARADRQVAFQLLEASMEAETAAQIRHIHHESTEAELERYDAYRWKVTQAYDRLMQAERREFDAYCRWSGRPTIADDDTANDDDNANYRRQIVNGSWG